MKILAGAPGKSTRGIARTFSRGIPRFAEFQRVLGCRSFSPMALIHFDHAALREGDAPELLAPPQAARSHTDQRRQLVMRALWVLRRHLGEPVTIAELSRAAGVSDRTLRAAFHDVIGVSPKQFEIAQRLRSARMALLAADPKTTTVTDVATEYGFYELGQFAGRYRHAFGELPSRTLQHAAARWPMEAA